MPVDPEYPTPQATGAYDRDVSRSLTQKARPALDFPNHRLCSMATELASLRPSKISTVVNMLSSPVMRCRRCCSRAAEKGFYLGNPSLLIVAPAAAVAGALGYGATGAVVSRGRRIVR